MPRARNITPSRKVTTMIPEDIMCEIDMLLFSGAEGRIPFGSYQKLFTHLLKGHLQRVKEIAATSTEGG